MKNRTLLISLLSLALVATGCNNSSKGGRKEKEIDFSSFEEASSYILENHNYSTHLLNQFNDEPSPFAEFNFYNLNNDAMYDDLSGYYSGFVKQRGQGIITFMSPLNGNGIVAGHFVATNTELDITDYYQLNVENILSKTFTFDETKNSYVSTDFDAMAVIGNLAFGEYVVLTSAPEYITAKFEDNKIIINAMFGVDYFDEVEVHKDADITLTISSIGSTRNKAIEGYVRKPDYTFKPMTEWDSGIKEYFDAHFNSYYPPFIENLSYAVNYGESVSEGFNVVMLEDLYSGNLVSSYANKLVEAGFIKVSNPAYEEYVLTVEDTNLVHKYSIKMKFYAPTDVDADGMEYRYLYPNGVFSVKFLHKSQTKEEIVNVGLLNQYISNTSSSEFLPSISLPDTTPVKKFKDATTSETTYALVLKGTDGAYFNLYPASKLEAQNFVNAYVADLKSKGFESSVFLGQIWLSDDYGSAVKLTDPSSISEWTSSSYLQMRIEVTLESLEKYVPQAVTLKSISLSGQTTKFDLNGTFAFDGVVTAHYSNGTTKVVEPTNISTPDMSVEGEQDVTVYYQEGDVQVHASYTIVVGEAVTTYAINTPTVIGAKVTVSSPSSKQAKPGTAVVFKITLESGYTLNSVSASYSGGSVPVSGPNIMTGAYTFTMPEGDVTINVSVSSSTVKHSISYLVWDAANYDVLEFNDVVDSSSTLPSEAAENASFDVNIVLKDGYTLAYIGVEDDTITTSSFSYEMGTSDLYVNIFVTKDNSGGEEGGEEGGGSSEEGLYTSYSVDRPNAFSNPDYYDRYTITLNEDGTGTYQRENHNANPTTKVMQFKFTVSSNKITFTYESGDNTDFYNGFRLFDSNSTEPRSINNTGVINEDGSISVTLVKSGVLDKTYTFTK